MGNGEGNGMGNEGLFSRGAEAARGRGGQGIDESTRLQWPRDQVINDDAVERGSRITGRPRGQGRADDGTGGGGGGGGGGDRTRQSAQGVAEPVMALRLKDERQPTPVSGLDEDSAAPGLKDVTAYWLDDEMDLGGISARGSAALRLCGRRPSRIPDLLC
ncbi:hypothetical protein ABZP36_013646 [Zizania latifolia]